LLREPRNFAHDQVVGTAFHPTEDHHDAIAREAPLAWTKVDECDNPAAQPVRSCEESELDARVMERELEIFDAAQVIRVDE
jgi:hypothetical protein